MTAPTLEPSALAGAAEPAKTGRARRRRWLRTGVLIAALAAAVGAFVAVMLSRGDEGAAPARAAGEPRELSAAELRALAADRSRPIFWAGELTGRRHEVTETARGEVYIRYLPRGAPLGDPRPVHTSVGTYPLERAFQRTSAAGRRPGATSARAPGGGVAVWSTRRPSSVYLAYPGSDVLVEVFDPDAQRARRLALSGEVGPVR